MTRYRPDGSVDYTRTHHGGGPGHFHEEDLTDQSQTDYDEDDQGFDEYDDQQEPQQHHHARPEPVKPQHRRTRRQAKKKLLEKELNCGATKCTIIRCTAGPLTTNNNVVFKLRARVWAQTISEVIVTNPFITDQESL